MAEADPVPGDPELVERAGRHYQKVALAINDAGAKLRKITSSTADMHSQTVSAFRDSAEEVDDDISRVYERYDATGRALSGYAPSHEDAQAESLRALRQAQQAVQDLETARRLMAAAQGRIDAAPPGADTAADRGDYRRAEGAAEDASAALAAARRMLDSAIEARDAAAQRAMGGINHVVKGAELNDGWWANWGSKLVEWVGKIADWVAAAAGILALVSAWCPPVAAAFAAVATIASVISVAMKSLQAIFGDGSWSAVAWAAAGALAFGVGRAAMVGLRGTVRGVRAASKAFRYKSPITGRGKTIPGVTSRSHGLLPKPGDLVRDMRKVPAQLKDDVTGFQHFSNLRSAPRGASAGEVGEATYSFREVLDQYQNAGAWSNPEARRHLVNGALQYGTVLGAKGFSHYHATYSAANTGKNALEDVTAPSPSERLNLSNEAELAAPAGGQRAR